MTIPSLRIFLFVSGIPFAYFFGETLEKFLLEVIRFFVAVEPSNAVLFNLIYLIILLFPLLLYGVIVSVSLGGEAELSRRFLLILVSIGSGLVSYRLYKIWWLLRDIPEEGVRMPASTVFTPAQFYFLEKLLPYILLGAVPALVVSVGERWIRGMRGIFLLSLIAVLSTFLWLYATGKLIDLRTFPDTARMLLTSCLSGFFVSAIVWKARVPIQ